MIKHIIEKIPFPIGSLLAKIPFNYRLGKDYNYFKLLLNEIKSEDEVLKFSLKKMDDIFQFAKKYPFYNMLYDTHGILDLKIKSLDDINKIPIITKNDIKNYTNEFSGKYLLNTGGSSGKPFSFYVDKNAFAREWAHMHSIWEKSGYKHTDLKFTFRGKNIGSKKIIYNPIHNEFILNIYINPELVKNEFLYKIKKHSIKYFHGYPSAIFNFLNEIEHTIQKNDFEFIKNLNITCFLGSEYPTPKILEYLKNVWGFNIISWYGHSEMCILAPSFDNKLNYKPFPTYGFTEVSKDGFLIGTSFNNYDMPLIRYNTEDIVAPTYHSNGLVESFKIKEGRVGDYVIDKKGFKIPLTALIYGRHHEIFKEVKHIQVRQINTGEIELIIASNSNLKKEYILSKMDLSGVDLDISIKVTNNPILTKSGKVNLLVKT